MPRLRRSLPSLALLVSLDAGQLQTHSVDLTAGRVWRIAVEQQGIDVTVEVRSPEGRRLAIVDSPFDRQGIETLAVSPESSGVYAVEIRSREPGAPPGRYELRVDELPRDRFEAEAALTRAGERYFEGTAEARRQALSEYRKAREAWRTIGDRREEARSLYAMAVLSRLVGQTREALALGQEVLPLWQALGDRLWEGNTWNEIGLGHLGLGDGTRAREAFEKAVETQRQTGDRYGEGASRSNLCFTALAQGDLRAGLACYEEALPVLREALAPALEGAALINVGRVYDVLGEPERARDHYRQALDRMRATGDRMGEAQTLNHAGLLDLELGETREALTRFGQALDIFRTLEKAGWQGTVLHNIGLVYQSLGEWPRAVASYEEALRLRRESGDRTGEAATLTNLGLVHAFQGGLQEALDFHRRALALRRELGDRWGEGVALTQLGRATRDMGDPRAAISLFDQAVELLHAVGARADEAEALRNRGDAWLALGEPAKALENFQEALRLARAAGHRPGEAQAEQSLALAERRLGNLAVARAHAEAALGIYEDLRSRIAGPDLRASFSGLRHQAYELHLELWMESHRAEPAAGWDRAALESSERARARTLLELLGEAGVDVHQGVDPALLERRTSLLRRLGAKAERALRGGADRAALEEERLALLRDLDVVEAEIRERSPGYADLTQPRTLRASEIQSLLDPDTLLLSYALGEERSFLWAVTPETVESFELPGRPEIETAARRLHEALSAFSVENRLKETQDAAALGRTLLGPVAARLGGRRIVVVADGALQYIPFGALLLSDAVPLLERHEVAYLPSASALAVQRRVLAARPPAPRLIALLADPVFGPGDPRMAKAAVSRGGEGTVFERLPASRQEAEAIAALAPPGEATLALGLEAALPRVLGDRLGGFRIVHFATHGVIDAERPALSGLALSMVDEKGNAREGFLHLHDIYNLRLDADLVVLSGCRTALGREVRGEGLIGLARGFQYAGARRVLASLWRVEDRATAALMERFYRALWIDKLAPAAALRAAQLHIRQQRRWRDPYYWAGFVLAGDWS